VVSVHPGVPGRSFAVCLYLSGAVEGGGSSGVPSRSQLVGCIEGRADFVVFESNPLHCAWVRVLRCPVMLVWPGGGACRRGPPRIHFATRWGPQSVFLSHYLAFFVLFSR